MPIPCNANAQDIQLVAQFSGISACLPGYMIQTQLYYLRMMEPPCLYLCDTYKRLDVSTALASTSMCVPFEAMGETVGEVLPPTMVKEISLLSGARCLCTQLDLNTGCW
jgi:hypothetical protein